MTESNLSSLPGSSKNIESESSQSTGKVTLLNQLKSPTSSQRVREFAGENLSVLLGKLFCNAFRETLPVKKTVLIQNVKSVIHATGKERLASKQAKERNIADMRRKCDKDEHPLGETLSEEVKVYRIKVVTSFLKARVPLSKIDCFRDLLEENAFRLSQASNLSQLVPFIHQQEQISVKNQIDQQEISIIFYGTTHVCEALVILIRFVDEKWNIQQRVVKLMLLAKSFTGEEAARQLIVSLTTQLGIESDLLIAAMCDCASVNDEAILTLSIVVRVPALHMQKPPVALTEHSH